MRWLSSYRRIGDRVNWMPATPAILLTRFRAGWAFHTLENVAQCRTEEQRIRQRYQEACRIPKRTWRCVCGT